MDYGIDSSNRIQDLVNKYRNINGEVSSSSLSHLPSTPMCRTEPRIKCPVSGVLATTSSSSSLSIKQSVVKPPASYPRFTPRRVPHISPPTNQSSKIDKSCQVQLPCNDENAPPQTQPDDHHKLKQEIISLKATNGYLMKQMQKMQAEVSANLMSSSSSDNDPPPTIFGNDFLVRKSQYDVQKTPIGNGASCVVHRAFDKARQEMVAIKVVSLSKLNQKDVQDINREVEILRNLKNEEFIINLLNYEYTPAKGRLCLVLEYGETDLNTYLQHTPCLEQANSKLAYHRVCLLWQQMLRAVHCIHKQNIVHKDLKPQNFLMVKGKLKLIDFGISQRICDDVTSVVIIQPEGTPNYIAPEMLSGTFGMALSNILSYRSDIFSLGCILYKMCYGVTPYQHIRRMQMKYAAITSDEAIPIRDTLKYPDLRTVLELCLDKNRQNRPTVTDLLEM